MKTDRTVCMNRDFGILSHPSAFLNVLSSIKEPNIWGPLGWDRILTSLLIILCFICFYDPMSVQGELRSISEVSSCFFGPRPWHIEIRHRVKKTSAINLFGSETLKLKIRRLKSWKPTVRGSHGRGFEHRSKRGFEHVKSREQNTIRPVVYLRPRFLGTP